MKLAGNTVLALHAYELTEDDYATPAEVARKLLSLTSNREALYDEFARHILTNLRGIELVETLDVMFSAGDNIKLTEISKRLQQRGLSVARGTSSISSMRQWLAKARVFDPKIKGGSALWRPDPNRVRNLLGIGLDAIDRLSQLTPAQRAYLRALISIPDPDPLIANKVADHATALYSVEYNHKALPKTVLFRLRDDGYIRAIKTTAGGGAKPYEVTRTDKFHNELAEPILRAAAEKAGLAPRELFVKPLSQILDELGSTQKNVKGKALELLAVYMTRLLDLEFKGWRLRSSDTGGAEVDVIVEGARLIFTRWQIQAKNTKQKVRLDPVAKEVGLALTFTFANVVVVVTTSDFTTDAYQYATSVMRSSNLNVILLNGRDLRKVASDPTNIVRILNSKAAQAMKLKERSDYFVS